MSSASSLQAHPIADLGHWVGMDSYKILKRHEPEYTQLIMDGSGLCEDVAGIVAEYVVDGEVMDRTGWAKTFGVDIGPETKDVQEALKFPDFYETYHAPNPIDVVEEVPVHQIRQVCQSCIIPTVRPQTVKRLVNNVSEDFSLAVLGDIAKAPVNGHPAKYMREDSTALRQHGTAKAGPASLVMMLKDVAARGRPWSEESDNPKKRGQVQYLENEINKKTKFGCRLPDALSQNTAVLVHHALTGERLLGSPTGKEGSWTYGRTIEQVRHGEHFCQMLSGGFGGGGPTIGGRRPSVLTIGSNHNGDKECCVAVLR